MVSRRARRSRRRRLALVGLVALAAVLVAARLATPAILESVLMRTLAAEGLEPAHLKLAWHGLTRLSTGPITLGASGALTADSAEISFSPGGLASGRIDTLTLTGLHLAATMDSNGTITLQDLPPLPAGGAGGPLPVARIRLENAKLDATTPYGPVTIALDGTVDSGPTGLTLASALEIGWKDAHLTLPSLAVTPVAEGWHVEASHAEARVGGADVMLHDIAAGLDWQAGAATLKASFTAADARAPVRFPALAVTLDAVLQGDKASFTLAGKDEKSHVALSVKGEHALASGRGRAEVAAHMASFSPAGLQPRDLSPALAKDLPQIAGTLALSGPVSWNGGRLAPRLTLSFADLGGDFGAARLSGGHGALLLDSLAPPSTPPDQPFAGTIEAAGESLPVEAHLQLRRDGTVAIGSLTLGLAGGTLATGNLLLKPAEGLPPDIALPIKIGDVDLGALLKLVDVDGLSGEGRLDGMLPLHLVSGPDGRKRLLLQEGTIAGKGAGVVRYSGNGLPAEGSGAGAQSVALLRDALKDFHYQNLAAELEEASDGTGAVTLHLDGSNPAVLDGRRFRLNIRLDANFDRLTDIFLSGLEAAQTLTRNTLAPQR